MFDNALKTFIKNKDNSQKGKEEKQPEVKHKLNIDMFEKNIKKNYKESVFSDFSSTCRNG